MRGHKAKCSIGDVIVTLWNMEEVPAQGFEAASYRLTFALPGRGKHWMPALATCSWKVITGVTAWWPFDYLNLTSNSIAFCLQNYSFLQLVFLKNFKREDFSQVLLIAPLCWMWPSNTEMVFKHSYLPSHEKTLKNQISFFFFFFTNYIFKTTLYVLV